MKVLIDADACPVTDIAISLCKKEGIHCLLFCDTAHEMHRDGAQTLVFDKGADSVDFALVNRVSDGDIVVTQDYGLASMCLAKKQRFSTRMAGHIRKTTLVRCCFSAVSPGNTGHPAAESKAPPNAPVSRTKTLNRHCGVVFSNLSRDKYPVALRKIP